MDVSIIAQQLMELVTFYFYTPPLQPQSRKRKASETPKDDVCKKISQ